MAGNIGLIWPGTLLVCMETLLVSAGSSEMKLHNNAFISFCFAPSEAQRLFNKPVRGSINHAVYASPFSP